MAVAAPAVQSLANLVSQFTAAEAPESSAIDNEVSANDQSGTAATSGINAAKDAAFTGITQNANARGATFSGFTPNAEASYVGSSYLPALAKLQTTIAATRNTLLGQKATLTSTANTNAINERSSEQKDLTAYNEQLQSESAAANLAKQQEAFQAKEDAINQAAETARAAASSSNTPNVASIVSKVGSYLSAHKGGDQKVSPNVFAEGLRQWVSAGGDPSSYQATFLNYANLSHSQDYGIAKPS